jgi:hypothetical protein
VHIRSGERTLLSVIAGTSSAAIGQTVRFNLAAERVHLFNMEGQRIGA